MSELRDALAQASHDARVAKHPLNECVWRRAHEVEADAVLADPSFLEALTKAILTALRDADLCVEDSLREPLTSAEAAVVIVEGMLR